MVIISNAKVRYIDVQCLNGCCVCSNPYNPLNLIKLVINIHIWVKLYIFGRKYTHSGVNNHKYVVWRPKSLK